MNAALNAVFKPSIVLFHVIYELNYNEWATWIYKQKFE